MGCLKLHNYTTLQIAHTSNTARSREGKSDAGLYKYKYQGQERQDELGLNWDSFKWRNYDYAIGRFFNIDPLSEKYNYQSHYNFSENRVVDCRELEGLEAVRSTKLDSNGNTVHVLEKNIIVLVHKTDSNLSERQNNKIINQNNKKINSVIEELNSFYGGAKNSKGESAEFKFNVTGMPVDDTNMMPGREATQLALDNGIESSSILFEGGEPLISPAAIISTAYSNHTQGITDGVVVRTNGNDTDGKKAHEVGHTLKLKDDYDGYGVMSNPPTKVIPNEVDEIIKKSYEKKK
jgi:RHS repeat-associated protein